MKITIISWSRIKGTLSLWLTILFFCYASNQNTYALNEQKWIQVPESNYSEVLELIAMRAKANYEEISSWHGRMQILENNHFYGPNAAKMANADPNSIAHDSQHIFEEIRSTAEFTVDMRNDKLNSQKEKPMVHLKAIDLDQNVPVRKNGEYESVRAILTSEQYLWHMPDSNFSSKLPNVRAGKKVFIDKPSERKFSLSGDIRDPRIFFDSGIEDGKKPWETLLRLKNDINDRIKERIEGYPHLEIRYLSADTGIKYQILTTWRGGENYARKYIRSLLEVDEAVGFNALKAETTNPDDTKTIAKEYTYEKIGEIYLPKTVKRQFWNHKGEPVFTSEITIETISLNEPLPEDTFTIKNLGVEDNTLVTDNIKKAEFRFSKGNLVPIAEPNNPQK
jgi:hypothetical protein